MLELCIWHLLLFVNVVTTLSEFKPDVTDAEHIELTVTAGGTLTRITRISTQESEHISLAVAASGALTHVDDL